jgi:hypothetical protein
MSMCNNGHARLRRAWFIVVPLASMLGVGVDKRAAGQSLPPKPPVPIDAISAIVAAFGSYPVVGLSPSGHDDERASAFVVALIRDPRFAVLANDIVVEGASGRYQDTMDRYLRGENVSAAELRKVWDDTTQQQFPGPMWTGEVPALPRAVREMNAQMPVGRKLRVLLGDPPIEWEHVHTPADYRQWLEQRDSYPAAVIQREVIAKQRRGLVLFGGMHLQRKQQVTNYQMDDPRAQTVISLVERAGTKTFIIRAGSERDGMQGWSAPSLAILRGTTLGARDEPPGSLPRVTIKNGTFVPIPREQWISMRYEDQTDALIYLGPSSEKTVAAVSRDICHDTAYIHIRLKRMALTGLPPSESARLRQLCGL